MAVYSSHTMWFVFDILHQMNFFLVSAMMLFTTVFNKTLGKDAKFPPFLFMIIPLFLCLVQITAYMYIHKIANYTGNNLLMSGESQDFIIYFSSFFSSIVITLFVLGALRYLILLFGWQEGTVKVMNLLALIYGIGLFVFNILYLRTKAVSNLNALMNYSSWSILSLDSLIFIPFGVYAFVQLLVKRDDPQRQKYVGVALPFLMLILFAFFDLIAIDRRALLPSDIPFRLSFISFSLFIIWSLYHLMRDKVQRVLPIYTNEDYTKALTKTGLSDREIEILEQVAEGNPNKEIAEALFISENTVKTHIKNIYKKLSISSRIQLHKYLEKIRLTHPGD